MEHRLWRKKSNCIQTNETPSLKEEGETVANLVLLEMSRDYKIKGKKIVHNYCTQIDKVAFHHNMN